MKKIVLFILVLFIISPALAENAPKNTALEKPSTKLNADKESQDADKAQEQDKDKEQEKAETEEAPAEDNVAGTVVTNEKTVSWQEYSKKMQEKVNKSFNPPNDPENKIRSVAIICKVSKDGALLGGGNVFLVKSSGFKEFDNAAIQAVKASAPFDKFPENSKQTSAIMRFFLTNY